jgi:ADP-ribose pyrophosphatase YjhB (NUDIX family)
MPEKRATVRAVAIIVRDQQVLTVRRTVPTGTYHVLPGGGVLPGESIEEACRREAQEETGLTVRVRRKVMSITNRGRLEHYFFVEAAAGEARLGGPEAARNIATNRYELVWVDAAHLETIGLVPDEALGACRELLCRTA